MRILSFTGIFDLFLSPPVFQTLGCLKVGKRTTGRSGKVAFSHQAVYTIWMDKDMLRDSIVNQAVCFTPVQEVILFVLGSNRASDSAGLLSDKEKLLRQTNVSRL